MTTVSATKPQAPAPSKSILHPMFTAQKNIPSTRYFCPAVVAVIGASERAGSVGRSVLWNLLSSPFGGTVFPVNAKRSNVLGIKAYPSVRDLPDKVDLVVVTTPADTVPDLIAESVELGIPAAIVISAGFKEHGEHGKELERQISQIIRGKMRLIGPNCLGVMNPVRGLNATFAHTVARPGNVGLHQPERRAVHRGAGLEPARECRLQRLRLHRLHARRELGRPDRLLRQRSAHPQHRDLHGIHRRRAVVPLGRARGFADQADHRHQGRTHRCRRQGRRLAHRLAHRQRRSARCRLPPQRRAAREQHRRHLLHVRGAGQAAAAAGQAALHRDQRRRPGRARHRRAGRGRRRTGRAVAGDA